MVMKETLKFGITLVLWGITVMPLYFVDTCKTKSSTGFEIYTSVLSVVINLAIVHLYHTLVSKVFDLIEAEGKSINNEN